MTGPELRWNPDEPGDPMDPLAVGRWEVWADGRLSGWSTEQAAAEAEMSSRYLGGPPVEYPR